MFQYKSCVGFNEIVSGFASCAASSSWERELPLVLTIVIVLFHGRFFPVSEFSCSMWRGNENVGGVRRVLLISCSLLRRWTRKADLRLSRSFVSSCEREDIDDVKEQ